MAAIQDLLKRVTDADLRARLEEEFNRLNKQKKFGLVFEEHLPECTPLYGVNIRVGTIVATKIQDGGAIFKVKAIDDGKALCVGIQDGEDHEFNLDDLVAVARFGDPIYPILEKVDEIEHGGGDLWHTLIQADNYHALQLLEYLYPGKVDCIYIDPPYNTGAKDWKYNNDYVDSNDAWRHSKWLSMMERRLALAKKLLNPKDSVLIVTIDEKEYLHLGMLLEQMFPEARIEMVTSVISAKGVVRPGQFSRVEEYIFIVSVGSAGAVNQEKNMLDDNIKKSADREIDWLGFRRRAPQAKRASRPNQFYPVFVNEATGMIDSIGDVVPHGVDRTTISVPVGCVALWPLSKDGDERLWSLVPEVARKNWRNGYLRVKWNAETKDGTVYYLASGTIADIETGVANVVGRDIDGAVQATYTSAGTTPPKRVWNMRSHNAESYGTNLLQGIIGNRFTYPKSLYAVHDAIRFFVANKPNALVLDFFAGSGTTLHAVNLLNAEDGGKRRCILVTNNEVSAEEAKEFAKRGVKPGDEEWEAKGIAQYVTWPRTVCSIKGVNVKGEALKGEYLGNGCTTPRREGASGTVLKMSDGFQSNAIFFKLGFVNPTAVSLGRAFKDILPILWMKAGAVGRCPVSAGDKDMLVLPENKMAILKNEAAFAAFKDQVKVRPEIRTVYLVTDFEPAYKSMAKAFHGCKTYQIYRDYLDNFRLAKTR